MDSGQFYKQFLYRPNEKFQSTHAADHRVPEFVNLHQKIYAFYRPIFKFRKCNIERISFRKSNSQRFKTSFYRCTTGISSQYQLIGILASIFSTHNFVSPAMLQNSILLNSDLYARAFASTTILFGWTGNLWRNIKPYSS